MIDYNELDNYYIGVCARVTANAGGWPLELSANIQSLFYKLDEYHYMDINRKSIAQVLMIGNVITSSYVIFPNSIRQVTSKKEIKKNSSFVKRLNFKTNPKR